MKFPIVPQFFLGILLVLSGCVSFTVTSTAGPDATLDSYRMVMNTSPELHSMIVQSANAEGYTDLEEYFKSGMEKGVKNGFSYREEYPSGFVHMIFEFSGPIIPDEKNEIVIDLGQEDDIRIFLQKTGNQVIYRDFSFGEGETGSSQDQQAALPGFELDYYLEMPGSIVESNADQWTGSHAEWHIGDGEPFSDVIYARAEVEPGIEQTASQPGLSGFGIPSVLAALIFIAGLAMKRTS